MWNCRIAELLNCGNQLLWFIINPCLCVFMKEFVELRNCGTVKLFLPLNMTSHWILFFFLTLEYCFFTNSHYDLVIFTLIRRIKGFDLNIHLLIGLKVSTFLVIIPSCTHKIEGRRVCCRARKSPKESPRSSTRRTSG